MVRQRAGRFLSGLLVVRRGKLMSAELARAVLGALVDVDFIAVRSREETVKALTLELTKVDRETIVGTVLHFLDHHDAIDEIYVTNGELAQVIEAVLERHSR
jgi:hypothetical protein